MGGAARVERGEAGSVHVWERKREENRKRITGAVREGNHYWNYMFAALDIIIRRN